MRPSPRILLLPWLALACAAHPKPPTAAPPAGADLIELSHQGEDVPDLAPHAVPGKITLFDFYATWCPPCREVDASLTAHVRERSDLAVRKLNIGSWETPLATRYLQGAASLPLVIVYGKDRRVVDSVAGLDLGALERAIQKASQP